jgi:cell division protein FtsI (penicillin-binding protein 3)
MTRDRKAAMTAGRKRPLLRSLLSFGIPVNPFGSTGHDDGPQHVWRRVVRRRSLIAVAAVLLWVVGLQSRLVYLQVVQYDKYAAVASRQQQAVLPLDALRGDIVDRNGELLAYSVKAQAIFADATLVVDPEMTAASLCRALADCTTGERTDLLRKLKSGKAFAFVRRSRQVSPEQVARVAALDLPGIGFQRDTGRYYPRGSVGAHIIGFVGQDNTGQAGLEHAYDAAIRGVAGKGRAQVDAKRNRVSTLIEREPVPGARLELTIDLYLQHIVERELAAGILKSRAQAGTAIVMDPRTGEILALASYPTFDPNLVGHSTPEMQRNRATQDVYEPGSTFKVVTASAAIQERIVTPSELIDTRPGFIKFGGRKAITESSGHNYGVITFEDSLIKSSNVGAIKVGLRIGAERLTRFVNRFGFGQESSPDFPGQSRGIWNPSNLNDSGLASVSMGYQVSVTPLQMAAAVSAVANGGLLMQPRVVRALVRNGVREVVQPKVLRRAIDEDTAAQVARMMEGVVTRGTGRAAIIDGYPAAGKTGTAHKVAEGGGYSRSDYNASFVGFIPAEEPVLTILVVIDSPRTSIYGSTVAAPVFRNIADRALQYLGVSPSGDGAVPMTVRANAKPGPSRGHVRVTARDPAVVRTGASGPVMPDLRGLGAREAVRLLATSGLQARLTGEGFVEAQFPVAGAPIDAGGIGVLALSRTAVSAGELP